jgi:hypothetical protein
MDPHSEQKLMNREPKAGPERTGTGTVPVRYRYLSIQLQGQLYQGGALHMVCTTVPVH